MRTCGGAVTPGAALPLAAREARRRTMSVAAHQVRPTGSGTSGCSPPHSPRRRSACCAGVRGSTAMTRTGLPGLHAWWRPILQTDQDWTLVATMALLLAGLGAYWWPRRRRHQLPIGADHRRRACPRGRDPRHGCLCPVPRRDEHDGHHVLDTAAVRRAAAEHDLPERAPGCRLHRHATARAAARADRRARRDADRRARRGVGAVAAAA